VTPTPKQIDAIIPFLDRFTAEGFSVGTRHDPNGQLAWLELSEAVTEFEQALYDNGWVTPAFNWTEWQDTAREFEESPEKIESADAVTIQKLFTTHVRADGFCEGHLAAMFENGQMIALLRRLREIYPTRLDPERKGPSHPLRERRPQ